MTLKQKLLILQGAVAALNEGMISFSGYQMIVHIVTEGGYAGRFYN